jgi:hypothetical protein
MPEKLLFNTFDDDTPQIYNGLGPWLENPHNTIDQPPKLNFSRHHLLFRKERKETTTIKLPLIANRTLIKNMAVDESSLQWQPRTKRKIESEKASTLVSQSMDFRKNPSPPSLEML